MSNTGLEQVVRQLQRDPAFRHAIVQDLVGALRASGIALSAAEWALLRRVDALLLTDDAEPTDTPDRPVAA